MALVLVTGVIYAPILHHPFISFDDPEYVVDNSQVRAGLTWRTFTWAWTSLEHANWHPFTWISHAMDVQVFGMNPAGHHLTSLLLHALNAALLFLFLAIATRSPGASLGVAGVFAVHPLNVESVAWVAERKDLLCTFWLLTLLLAYLNYARKPNRAKLLTLSLLFTFALASKPMAISAPFLLLLVDRWPLQRVTRWSDLLRNKMLWAEKIPLFVLAAGSGVVTIVAQHRSDSISSLEVFPLAVRLGNALTSYGFYGLRLLWPSHLAILYPWPRELSLIQLALATSFLCLISGVAWRQREHRPYLLVGWLWFLGSLVPVIGIVQVGSQAHADRYAYLPMIGLLVASVWTLAEFVQRKPLRVKWAHAGALVVVGIFAVVSRRQIKYWSSDYDLWLHAFHVTTDNYLAANKVGVALQNEGRYDEALGYFERAWHINPADPLANFNIGVHCHVNGDFETAIRFYQVTANQNTTPKLRAEAFENMGTAYRQLGDDRRARESYLNALEWDPTRNRIYAALREMNGNGQR